MNKKLKILPAAIWLLVILFLSGYPGNKLPPAPFFQFDKLIHSIMYFALYFFLAIAFYKQYYQTKTRLKAKILISFFAVFYGGFMEILQHYIFINRSGNFYDFAANTFGVIIGILFFPLIIKILPINKWLG